MLTRPWPINSTIDHEARCMFTLRWLDAALADYDELKQQAEAILQSRATKGKKKSSKQEGLFKQVQKALTLLRDDPRHPVLQTHEYLSIENPFYTTQKVFEAYAQLKTPGAYRVFWCYGPGKKKSPSLPSHHIHDGGPGIGRARLKRQAAAWGFS